MIKKIEERYKHVLKTHGRFSEYVHGFKDCMRFLKEKPGKMTNFERIKQMTVDELAKFIATDLDGTCFCCNYSGHTDKCGDEYNEEVCKKGIMEWLESEVEK